MTDSTIIKTDSTLIMTDSTLIMTDFTLIMIVCVFVDDALKVVPSGPRMKPHPCPCRPVLRDGMASTNPDVSYLKKNMNQKSESKDVK